jgi:hypothetical protein
MKILFIIIESIVITSNKMPLKTGITLNVKMIQELKITKNAVRFNL